MFLYFQKCTFGRGEEEWWGGTFPDVSYGADMRGVQVHTMDSTPIVTQSWACCFGSHHVTCWPGPRCMLCSADAAAGGRIIAPGECALPACTPRCPPKSDQPTVHFLLCDRWDFRGRACSHDTGGLAERRPQPGRIQDRAKQAQTLTQGICQKLGRRGGCHHSALIDYDVIGKDRTWTGEAALQEAHDPV